MNNQDKDIRFAMLDSAVIAVVDDDERVLVSLESLLRSCGYSVNTYNSALAFLQSGGATHTDCLISDIQMPGMCGVELYEALAARSVHIPTLFITGRPGPPPQFSARVRRPEGYFSKPFDTQALLACIDRALQRRR